MRRPQPESKPGFFDFIGWRRRAISDRTWFGLAFVAVGVGVPTSEGGWSWLLTGLLIPAAALIASGVRRGMNRVGLNTGERRPAPPW